MAELFEFPEGPTSDRRSIAVFLTPHPEDTEAAVLKMGNRFGISAKPRDAGARHVFATGAPAWNCFAPAIYSAGARCTG